MKQLRLYVVTMFSNFVAKTSTVKSLSDRK